jgi:hypothetical protein
MIGASHEMSSLGSGNGQDHGRGPLRRFGRPVDLTHGKNNPDGAGVTTIRHWSDSFTYNGLVYKYTMVGTDPRRGSSTTVIPTVLVPMRFVFADGNVFDATTDNINGQTPIQGIINSPIFQNYNFNKTSVKVGNTQFGDAFQRANFWNSVSTSSPNYHILLGQPAVLPLQTLNVPYGKFDYYYDPVFGPQPLVDEYLLENATEQALASAANFSPDTLVIVVWGQIFGSFGVGGYHGATSSNGNSLRTFIATSYGTGNFYEFPNLSGIFFSDSYVLSHEVAEWMDDPFANNFTPGWDIAFPFPGQTTPDVRCDSFFIAYDRLEVADPVEFFLESDVPLPAASYTYHVTETVFIDWFTRASQSRSYRGQYSMFEIGLTLPPEQWGKLTPPTPVCTGHVEFTPTYVDFPGAVFTVVNGINNKGMATGTYIDHNFAQRGFIFDGSTYSTLDFPSSFGTYPSKINDAGMIVGGYNTSSTSRGFSYTKGQWTPIDFPGAADTEVYGVNSSGAMVGLYDATQPVTHAFIVQNGQYRDLPNPFGTQTNAFAINDLGSITGLGYTDPSAGPFTPFILSRGMFSPFQFPGSVLSQLSSINNANDLAGVFIDPDGTFWGMVTVNGVPYQVNAAVNGNNDFQQICGYTFDPNTGKYRGFIGTLPLARNSH